MNDLPILVVLAGGKGTRLQSVVNDRPKILAKIANKPFIEHLLKWASTQGLKRIHFCLGVKAEQVVNWLEAQQSELNISWHIESCARGTGGAISDAIEHLKRDGTTELLVCNGDTFVDFDLTKFVGLSKEVGGGMLTTQVEDAARFGMVEHTNGLLSHFAEKQQIQKSGEINAGWYYLGKAHMDALQKRTIVSFETEYLMDPQRPPIKCINIGQNFLDFGTPESYLRAQALFQELL